MSKNKNWLKERRMLKRGRKKYQLKMRKKSDFLVIIKF